MGRGEVLCVKTSEGWVRMFSFRGRGLRGLRGLRERRQQRCRQRGLGLSTVEVVLVGVVKDVNATGRVTVGIDRCDRTCVY